MLKAILLGGRAVSALGSVLTAATLPLYLANTGQAGVIPFCVVGLATGRIVSAQMVLPRLGRFSAKTVLLFASALGALGLSLAAASDAKHVNLLFPFLAFLAAFLGTIDDAFAQTALGSLARSARWVHLDSSVMTLCRVLAPGMAVSLLLLTQNDLTLVLLIDAATYAAAGTFYFFFLNEETQPAELRHSTLWQALKRRRAEFVPLAAVSLGAAAYNAGAIIHLQTLSLSIWQISVFIMTQNGAMVLTGLALARWPELTERREAGVALAAAGQLLLALAPSFVLAAVGTAVMSLGMVVVLQGLRGRLASQSDLAAGRMELGALAAVNSGMGILGALLWTSISMRLSWAALLCVGAGVISLALFPKRRIERR